MPVIGLPNILESTLNNILDNLRVSSWNIKGAEDHMQVWIRFKTDIDTEKPLDITYRKVPPSQIKRNKDRAKGWQNSIDNNQCDDTVDSVTDKSNNGASQTPPLVEKCAFNQATNTEPSTVIDHERERTAVQPSPLSSHLDSSNDHTSDLAIQQPGPPETSGDQRSAQSRYKQYGSNESSQRRRRRRPFRYKSVHVEWKCRQCGRDYENNTPSQSYFCTLCPAFFCRHCIDSGHHMHHQNTIKGPASLQRICERYGSY